MWPKTRDVKLEIDDRGRGTIPRNDRLALGIADHSALLNLRVVEVVRVEGEPVNGFRLVDIPERVLEILDDDQVDQLREVAENGQYNAENPFIGGDHDG